MFTAFIIILLAIFAGVAILGSALYSRRYGWLGFGAIAGIAVLLLICGLFWHQAVLGLAIFSLVILGLGVTLQKVEPVRALTGAIAAMLLFFAFTWLAVQLADTFFFEKESAIQRWWNSGWPPLPDSSYFYWPNKSAQLAAGIACLVASVFLNRVPKAILVFLGILLLALQVPYLIADGYWYSPLQLIVQDPLAQVACLFFFVAVVLRTLSARNGRRDSHKP